MVFSIVKNRRCCVLEDKIRDTVPSVEEAKSGRVTSCNEPHGNEESLEKPRGKPVSPENSKAFLMEAAGIEQSHKSLGDKRISSRPTHNPTHGAPMLKDEAASIALQELITLWPTLTIASQNRVYELAQSEASRVASDASAKRGDK